MRGMPSLPCGRGRPRASRGRGLRGRPDSSRSRSDMLRAIAPTPGHRTHQQRENTDADHYARPAGVHNRPHSHLLSRYQDKRYPGPRRGNTDREFLNDPATEGSRQRNCNVNLDEPRSGRPDWPVLTGFLFCGHLWADRRHEGTCVQREWSRRAEVLLPASAAGGAILYHRHIQAALIRERSPKIDGTAASIWASQTTSPTW